LNEKWNTPGTFVASPAICVRPVTAPPLRLAAMAKFRAPPELTVPAPATVPTAGMIEADLIQPRTVGRDPHVRAQVLDAGVIARLPYLRVPIWPTISSRG